MSALDWRKLRAVIGMMGSDMPGEATNAANVVKSMLSAAELTWSDLAQMIEADSHGRVTPPDYMEKLVEMQNLLRHALNERDLYRSQLQSVQADAREVAQHRRRWDEWNKQRERELSELRAAYEKQLHLMRQSYSDLVRENDLLRGGRAPEGVSASERMAAYEVALIERRAKGLRFKQLPVTQRLCNVAKSEGWRTLGDVAGETKDRLLRVLGLGRKTYVELWAICVVVGLWPEGLLKMQPHWLSDQERARSLAQTRLNFDSWEKIVVAIS